MFDFPTGPTNGQTYSPLGGPTYQWSSSVGAWLLVGGSGQAFSGDVPPLNPIPNQLWWESDTGNLFIWYVDPDTSQWVQVNVATTTQATASPKNLVVNPALQISQETAFGTGINTSGAFIVDQCLCAFSGPVGGTNINFSAVNITNPVPFVQMNMAGTGAPYPTVGAGQYACIRQAIEGQMFASDLNWGTNSAVPAVLSFDAYCTIAGTYAAAIRSSNNDRSIVFPVAFSAGELNIWKKFTFAIPATTTGTFPRDNTKGMELWFTPMAETSLQAPASGVWQSGNYVGVSGQSNLLATANQTIYLRKIGLYADPNGTGLAPPFVVPNYDDELRRCQRYFRSYGLGELLVHGYGAASGQIVGQLTVSPTMRVTPTHAFVGSTTYSNASGIGLNSSGASFIRQSAVVTAVGTAYAYSAFVLNARM